MEILEYRGVEGLVAAEVLKDDSTGYVTDTPFEIAGVAEISKTNDSASEAHYYNNIPAIVVTNTSSDTITISASAIPLEPLAKITGQEYDASTGALIEGQRTVKYFAIGYKTKKTNGDEMYVWRYKGTFNVPDQTNTTENNTTDANGQEIVFTGVSTTYKFTKTNKGAKAIVVDSAKQLCDVSTFFNAVVTPDTLGTTSSYKLTITQAEDTEVVVIRGDSVLHSGDWIATGDVLTVFVTGGTMTINGTSAASGDTVTVSSAVTIVSTAT